MKILGGYLPDRPPEPLSTVDLRRPHRETRVIVDKEGHDVVKVLYRLYDEFNADFFAAKLSKDPLILVAPTKSPRAFGDASAADWHGLRSPIRIRPDVFRRGGPNLGIDVLLHEMVHVWQFEVIKDLELGYQSHGPRFAMRCNEIRDLVNAKAGREVITSIVMAKGRKGYPSASQWPCNVRPPGWYENDFSITVRRKPKAKTLATSPEASEPATDENADGASSPKAARAAARASAKERQQQLTRDLPRLLEKYAQHAVAEELDETARALRVAAAYLRGRLQVP